MTNLIFLIILRFSWLPSPGASAYRLYAVDRGKAVLLIETADTSVNVSLPQFAVSAVKGSAESELSAPAVFMDSICLDKVAELRKVCGKKCRKVK